MRGKQEGTSINCETELIGWITPTRPLSCFERARSVLAQFISVLHFVKFNPSPTARVLHQTPDPYNPSPPSFSAIHRRKNFALCPALFIRLELFPPRISRLKVFPPPFCRLLRYTPLWVENRLTVICWDAKYQLFFFLFRITFEHGIPEKIGYHHLL